MNLSRDSLLWWLLMAGAVVGYLANASSPDTWTWSQWMQALSAVIGIVAGKLATSPLAGAKKDDAVDLRKIGTLVVLAVVISGMSVVGCGPTTKPTLVKTDAAVYQAVKAIHETAVVLGQSGVITPAQELRIQQALQPVARLGEQATRVIVAWKSGPTPPELQQLVKALGGLVSEITKVLPVDGPGKAALLEKVALAQQAILMVLAVMGGMS